MLLTGTIPGGTSRGERNLCWDFLTRSSSHKQKEVCKAANLYVYKPLAKARTSDATATGPGKLHRLIPAGCRVVQLRAAGESRLTRELREPVFSAHFQYETPPVELREYPGGAEDRPQYF